MSLPGAFSHVGRAVGVVVALAVVEALVLAHRDALHLAAVNFLVFNNHNDDNM